MKNFGVKPYLFPMPTYMIGTYNEDDSVDVMMMAWGGICAEDMVALNLESEHKTVVNLEARRAFTLAVPGVETLEQSDFLGIATANKTADKFARSGLHAVKSERVDAPVITEYPLTLECEVVEMQNQPYGLRVLGRIVNVLADERDAQRLLRRGRKGRSGLAQRRGTDEEIKKTRRLRESEPPIFLACAPYAFQALTSFSSHWHQASTPSPVLAEMGKIFSSGLRLSANSRTLSMSKSK